MNVDDVNERLASLELLDIVQDLPRDTVQTCHRGHVGRHHDTGRAPEWIADREWLARKNIDNGAAQMAIGQGVEQFMWLLAPTEN